MNLITLRNRIPFTLWMAVLMAALLFTLLLFTPATPALADPSEVENMTATLWSPVSLPSDNCPAGDQNCHFGSPVLADINGDGKLEIIAVTNKGFVVAVGHNGAKLWEKDIAGPFGMSGGSHEIHARPAVADLDGDGHVEIVVAAGTLNPNVCTQGGVIVLDRQGNVKPGWPLLAADEEVPPAGCRDTIISSPALGDLDNDGDLEIVVGGFDKRIYAIHHDGSLMANYPPDSVLSNRFPTWPNIRGKLADNMWGSPALADIDGDGYLDIIMSTGEGNFDASHGGNAGDWSCPYELPPGWASGYCGGSLYVIDRFGNNLPGFPRYSLEALNSSPAVADVNGDGKPEIFVGTGDFYYTHSPSRPTHGFRLYGYDSEGNDLPGWGGGKQVGGTVTVSPSIGNITGDSQPEIVVIASDKKVYAWHANGSSVSGFPMTPRDLFGRNSGNYNTPMGIVLADYDGDGLMEIIFSQSGNVNVVDGNGAQLTATGFPGNVKPLYYADGQLLNTPAVGDIDGDGKLELVAANSKLYAWKLSDSSDKADWPMFKRDPQGASYVPGDPRLAATEELLIVHDRNRPGPAHATLVVQNLGDGDLRWEATAPSRVTLSTNSGTVNHSQTIQVTVNVSGLSHGRNDLGNIRVEATHDGQPVAGSPRNVRVIVNMAELEQNYLPMFSR